MASTFERVTEIDGLIVATRSLFSDERGDLIEFFKESELAANGIPLPLVQGIRSRSGKGVTRGLHYQLAPYAQGKFVQVWQGRAFDVAVDMRPDSSTYGQHYSIELSEENGKCLWIPRGFAHGFQALEDNTMFVYCISGGEYHHPSETGILWNDKVLGIKWPISDVDAIVNEKDRALPTLANAQPIFSDPVLL